MWSAFIPFPEHTQSCFSEVTLTPLANAQGFVIKSPHRHSDKSLSCGRWAMYVMVSAAVIGGGGLGHPVALGLPTHLCTSSPGLSQMERPECLSEGGL